ncbi:lamin tail domain-containing protein, partial [bacterium]|nr:lamin tail domain-containing protein [bacterium]
MKNTTRFWSFAIPSVLALFQAQSAVLDEGVTLDIGEVVINEFMASNDGGQTSNPNDWYPITNQINGTTHDWIEILNNSSSPLDLGGWHLTDDPSALEKWTFPSPTSIPAGGFLIVYASGLDTLDASGNFNTNFKLSSGGEYLALVNTSGTIESEFCPDNTNYPKQDEDI